jgi:hypothetical protein
MVAVGTAHVKHELMYMYAAAAAGVSSAPGVNAYAKPLPKPRVALTVGNGQCNLGMPNNVFDRFLWVINLYARAGFKVVIDNQ